MPIAAGASIHGPGFEATVRGATAEVFGADERFGLDSVMKVLLARALLARGGVLVHAVALEGAVLLGESGAGKSTLGRLGGDRLLSDELVAIIDGRAWGTPWNTGVARSAPLTLLGTLGWADAPRLEPVSAADFLPLMLSNTLLPDETAASRAAVFDAISKLLQAHPPQRFFFPPDARAVDFLRAQ
jgi:hypothetical protein